MDITGIGQYANPLGAPARSAQAAGAPAAATQNVAPQAPPAPPKAGVQVAHSAPQARDLLSDDERSYLEMLFPGATAVDTYGGKGTAPSPPTGSIVDRKG